MNFVVSSHEIQQLLDFFKCLQTRTIQHCHRQFELKIYMVTNSTFNLLIINFSEFTDFSGVVPKKCEKVRS